jgi:hypothetical protein
MLQYTIKGVACTVCRHGHVLSMMNCFGGERHAYAILAFWTLLMAGILVHCWWYDINCRCAQRDQVGGGAAQARACHFHSPGCSCHYASLLVPHSLCGAHLLFGGEWGGVCCPARRRL